MICKHTAAFVLMAMLHLFAQQPTAEPAPAAPEKIYDIVSGIKPPRFLPNDNGSRVDCKGRQGDVWASMVISSAGKPSQIHILKSASDELTSCAINMLLGYQFFPTMRKNQPVAVRFFMNVHIEKIK